MTSATDPDSVRLTSDSGSMTPSVRTDSRKLSPSTHNYDTDSRPLLELPALALASMAGSRQDDVVFDNLRQPNFCCWLIRDHSYEVLIRRLLGR